MNAPLARLPLLCMVLPSLVFAKEYACRLDLPLANSAYGQFPVDPVACVRDSLVGQYKTPSKTRLFSYGNTDCLACVKCGCMEGFLSTGMLYNYFGWAKDAKSVHINLANASLAPSSGSSTVNGFGPMIVKRSDTVSVCWVTYGDTLGRSRDTRKRRLNCLTRTDGVDSFSLRLIDPDTLTEIGSRNEPRCTEPPRPMHDPAYDATGRPTPTDANRVEPRFHRKP